MKKISLHSSPSWWWIVFFLTSVGIASLEAKTGRSEGADLVFGGLGTGPGEFTIFRDLTFDPQGHLYTLEAGGPIKASRTTEYTGVARVQKFTAKGEFISQFPLGDDLPADKTGQPMRLAVDGKGYVFVTFPQLGFVRQYGPDGKKIRDHALPGATGVALDVANGKERIAAIAGAKVLAGRKGWQDIGGDEVLLLDPEGGEPQHIALPQKLREVQDITVDKDGHFYVLAAATNSIYIYDDAGKLLKIIGAENQKLTPTRNADGSDPLFSVSVDSKGNVYSLTWGNPGWITMYTVDGRSVLMRQGQFKRTDVWFNGNYTPTAISPDDRLWIASVALQDPQGPNFLKFHFRPVVLRILPNFLDPTLRAVKKQSALTLGLAAKLDSKTLYNVTHEFAPIETDFVLPARNRNLTEVNITYHVYDLDKNTLEKGEAKLALQNGVEARMPITFTPKRYGWYTVEVQMTGGGEDLGGISEMFGVTPRYDNMPAKIEDFWKGWRDVPRQMFCGLNNIRLDIPLKNLDDPKNLESFEKVVAAAQAYGATWFILATDKKEDFTPEKLRPLIEKFKGRVPRYELFNEPNFSMTPEKYVELATPIYKMIKEVDPKAQVMGPAVCGIQLPWYKAFYAAGGAKVCDILTLHDYEGNDSISPEHWRWKFKELRKLMAQYGDEKKEIWQTERCIHGLRNIGLVPGAQAVRVTLHRDLLETLGVPSDHNNLYYLNEGGYISVPSYVWSGDGPHPAALALRTREALTKNLRYTGSIDFGTSGNDMLMGLRYAGNDGSVVILRNLGTLDMSVDATVKGGDTLEISDAFGNEQTLPVKDGKVTLTVPQLPTYLRLKPGQDVDFAKIDLGRNIAPSAQITYDGKSDSDVNLLQNGILESTHAGDPHGDTAGTFIWKGEILKADTPQHIELRWNTPRTISAVFLHGVRADNNYCALLDYDLEVWKDGKWKTLAEVRTPLPPSDPVAVLGAKGMTWLLDNNFWVNRFEPVTSDRIRITLRRTTYGVAPDEVSCDGRASLPPLPMLREIEVFAPVGECRISSQVEQPDKTAAFDHDTVTVKVTNGSKQPLQGVVRATAPEGWRVTPAQATVAAEPEASQALQFTIKPPAELGVGRTTIDFVLEDTKGVAMDRDALLLNVSAPLPIIPHPPGGYDTKAQAQSLSVMVKNLTNEPLSGVLKVEMKGPTTVPPVEVPYGPVEGGGITHINLMVPNVNIQEGAWTANYSTKVNGLIISSTQDLSIRQWSVIGSFAGDLETAAGPEAEIGENRVDIEKNYTDTFGGEQKWRIVPGDAKGKVDLFRQLPNEEPGFCYAAAWITSPKAQNAILSAAFNNRGKIWVNGREAIVHAGGGAFGWGQEQAMVELKAGSNLVLIKVAKDSGLEWAFLFDLLDPTTHQRLSDITYSPRPEK